LKRRQTTPIAITLVHFAIKSLNCVTPKSITPFNIVVRASRVVAPCDAVPRQVDVGQAIYSGSDLAPPQKLHMPIGEQVVSTSIPTPEATIARKLVVVAEPLGA
jgi:hypothetical protein